MLLSYFHSDMNPHCNSKETFNSVGPGPTGMGWKVKMKDTSANTQMDPKPECKSQPPRAVISLFFLLIWSLFLLQ